MGIYVRDGYVGESTCRCKGIQLQDDKGIETTEWSTVEQKGNRKRSKGGCSSADRRTGTHSNLIKSYLAIHLRPYGHFTPWR